MNSEVLRRQQIERYRGSPFDMAPETPRNPDQSKFKFQKECVFLAACLNEDMDEVKKLLDDGIDIDAANIDGLTALHQVNGHFSSFLLSVNYYYCKFATFIVPMSIAVGINRW